MLFGWLAILQTSKCRPFEQFCMYKTLGFGFCGMKTVSQQYVLAAGRQGKIVFTDTEKQALRYQTELAILVFCPGPQQLCCSLVITVKAPHCGFLKFSKIFRFHSCSTAMTKVVKPPGLLIKIAIPYYIHRQSRSRAVTQDTMPSVIGHR